VIQSLPGLMSLFWFFIKFYFLWVYILYCIFQLLDSKLSMLNWSKRICHWECGVWMYMVRILRTQILFRFKNLLTLKRAFICKYLALSVVLIVNIFGCVTFMNLDLWHFGVYIIDLSIYGLRYFSLHLAHKCILWVLTVFSCRQIVLNNSWAPWSLIEVVLHSSLTFIF
jgi:hypothetical protein